MLIDRTTWEPWKNEFKQHVKTFNYDAILSRMSQVYLPTPYAQQQLQAYRQTIERNAGIMQTLLDSSGDNQNMRNMLAFSMQKQQGVYSEDNDYANSYLDRIKALGGKDATVLSYTFDGDEYLTKFRELWGSNLSVNSESGLWLERDNSGKPVIKVNKSQFGDANLFVKFTNAINETNKYNAHWYDVFNESPVVVRSDTKDPGAIGNVVGTSSVLGPIYNDNVLHHILDEQSSIASYVTDADNLLDNTRASIYNKTVPTNVLTSGFKTKAHMDLFLYMMQGGLESSAYNVIKTQLDDIYNNRLSAGITQYNVYAANLADNPAASLDLVSPEDKGQLDVDFLNALHEGRVSAVAANVAGRGGTMITIYDSIGSNGEYVGGAKATRKLFVEGLFEEESNEIIDTDENGRLLRLKGDHAVYGHPYQLANGGQITNITPEGGILIINGNSRNIGSDELDAIMRENEQIKEAGYALERDVYQKVTFDNLGSVTNDPDSIKSSKETVDKARTYAKNIYKYDNDITDDAKLDAQDLAEIESITKLILHRINSPLVRIEDLNQERSNQQAAKVRQQGNKPVKKKNNQSVAKLENHPISSYNGKVMHRYPLNKLNVDNIKFDLKNQRDMANIPYDIHGIGFDKLNPMSYDVVTGNNIPNIYMSNKITDEII